VRNQAKDRGVQIKPKAKKGWLVLMVWKPEQEQIIQD